MSRQEPGRSDRKRLAPHQRQLKRSRSQTKGIACQVKGVYRVIVGACQKKLIPSLLPINSLTPKQLIVGSIGSSTLTCNTSIKCLFCIVGGGKVPH